MNGGRPFNPPLSMLIIVSYLWLHDNTTWEPPARATTCRVSPSSSTWRTNMQETVSSVLWSAALHLHTCTRFSCVKAREQTCKSNYSLLSLLVRTALVWARARPIQWNQHYNLRIVTKGYEEMWICKHNRLIPCFCILAESFSHKIFFAWNPIPMISTHNFGGKGDKEVQDRLQETQIRLKL